uniref:DDE Tnp4 domain-containing protein n=1 Tax=Brassica oleracea var. oleracea TaxID=109376 RepID=A0A0D3C2R2_BRAOL
MSSSSSDEVDEALEEMVDQVVDNFIDSVIHAHPNKPTKRAYIERNREQGHNQLWNDYFTENPTYPPEMFRRRFRMNKPLFLRIVERITNEVPYFQQRRNACGRNGLSALQKCTAAIRMLAYGQSGDTYDEYLRLGDSTSCLCLENFTNAIIHLFEDEYLRSPTPEDLQRLLDVGEEWKNYPTAWKGQYTRGSGKSTIVLEAVASQDTIKIGKIMRTCVILHNMIVENERHGYDQIDTSEFESGESSRSSRNWATFIQSIPLPQGPKAELFAERQESTRKDVERAFGVLQSRFAIVKNPALLWYKEKIGKIMRTCVILHNMIVENERHGYDQIDTSEFESEESSRSSRVQRRESIHVGDMLGIRREVRDKEKHGRLKADLMENIWQKFGNED